MPRLLVIALFSLSVLCSNPSVYARKISQQSLQQVEDKVQNIVAKVLPATVGIGAIQGPAGGSGVIVSKDGLILTAAHVVAMTGDDIMVYFPNGKRVRAKLLGADNDSDAAIVKISEPGEYPFVELGNSSELKVSDWMISLGHPGGFQKERTPPVRLGRMLGRRGLFITTDCTLIGGDSGGPLFNIDGKVVGIHSNIGSSLSTNNHVPIKKFKKGWERMLDGETWGSQFGNRRRRTTPNKKSPIIGVIPFEDPDEDENDKSVRVEALAGGPAAKAGTRTGDALLKIDDVVIKHFGSIRKAISSKKAGDEIKLTVRRKQQLKELTAKLISREEFARIESEPTKPERRESRKGPVERNDEITDAQITERLSELIEEAREKNSRLKLDHAEHLELGGYRRVNKILKTLLTNREYRELFGRSTFPRTDIADNQLKELMTTFSTVIDDASDSVISIYDDDGQVALATAIRDNGYLITKASELEDVEDEDALSAVVDEESTVLRILKKYPKYDLALVKIDVDVEPVDWFIPATAPALGSLVAAAGVDDQTLAVGVISVAERNLSGSDKGYLGVTLAPGVRIRSVQKASPAEQAGLRRGDILKSVDGIELPDVESFIETVKNKSPGDTIELGFERDGETEKTSVTLVSRAAIPMSMLQDGLSAYPTGGKLSNQRRGYPSAVQTDLPIRPEDCGSPVVDLQGRVLGINVARAGRTKSYAIPAKTIEKLVRDFQFEK